MSFLKKLWSWGLSLILACGLSVQVWAQNAPSSSSATAKDNSGFQKGQVVSASAAVYKNPDFDSPVIAHLKPGSIWMVSKKIYGAFYQIRLPRNRLAYVTDGDVRPLTQVKAAMAAAAAAKDRQAEKEQGREGSHLAPDGKAARRRKAFVDQDFQGVSFLGLRYREETMGLRPTDNILLVGFKATGDDVVVEGVPTELNVQLAPSVPRYYEQATGRSTEGFLFYLDTMILNTSAHGLDTMTFFGFGPFFRFSKFGVTLPVNGTDEFYSLEDMGLGLKLNYGISRRFGNFALRLDFQYYWEKQQYYGLCLSGQFSRSP